jgi:Cdc6-like AAA superfamily ATPase
MGSPNFRPPPSPAIFLGRDKELAWVERETSDPEALMRAPIAVVGPAGIGKTALVSSFFEDFFEVRKRPIEVAWIQCRNFQDESAQFDEFVRSFVPRARGRLSVVLDGADEIPGKDFVAVLGRVMNYKRVGTIIITKRDEGLLGKARLLRLGLDRAHAERMIGDTRLSLGGPGLQADRRCWRPPAGAGVADKAGAVCQSRGASPRTGWQHLRSARLPGSQQDRTDQSGSADHRFCGRGHGRCAQKGAGRCPEARIAAIRGTGG